MDHHHAYLEMKKKYQSLKKLIQEGGDNTKPVWMDSLVEVAREYGNALGNAYLTGSAATALMAHCAAIEKKDNSYYASYNAGLRKPDDLDFLRVNRLTSNKPDDMTIDGIKFVRTNGGKQTKSVTYERELKISESEDVMVVNKFDLKDEPRFGVTECLGIKMLHPASIQGWYEENEKVGDAIKYAILNSVKDIKTEEGELLFPKTVLPRRENRSRRQENHLNVSPSAMAAWRTAPTPPVRTALSFSEDAVAAPAAAPAPAPTLDHTEDMSLTPPSPPRARRLATTLFLDDTEVLSPDPAPASAAAPVTSRSPVRAMDFSSPPAASPEPLSPTTSVVETPDDNWFTPTRTQVAATPTRTPVAVTPIRTPVAATPPQGGEPVTSEADSPDPELWTPRRPAKRNAEEAGFTTP